MDTKGFYEALAFFARARDEYDRRGDTRHAQRCDDAIALAQNVVTDLVPPSISN